MRRATRAIKPPVAVRQRGNTRMEQMLGKDTDFGMGLGIHGSPT